MNRGLPIDDEDAAVLDDYFAQIDRELDVLFVDAVAGELQRIRVRRDDEEGDAAA